MLACLASHGDFVKTHQDATHKHQYLNQCGSSVVLIAQMSFFLVIN